MRDGFVQNTALRTPSATGPPKAGVTCWMPARPRDERCAFLPCTSALALAAPCIHCSARSAAIPDRPSSSTGLAHVGTAGEVFCLFPGRRRFPSNGGIDRGGKAPMGKPDPAPSEHSLDVSPRKRVQDMRIKQRCARCGMCGLRELHGWMSCLVIHIRGRRQTPSRVNPPLPLGVRGSTRLADLQVPAHSLL